MHQQLGKISLLFFKFCYKKDSFKVYDIHEQKEAYQQFNKKNAVVIILFK